MTLAEISKKVDDVIVPELKGEQGIIMLIFDTKEEGNKRMRGIQSSGKGIYVEDYKIAIEFLQEKLKEEQLLSKQSVN